MKPVDIVTIEKLIPIFKNNESANAIEVARIKDSNNNSIQYDIVVGKGIYKIDDVAIYIQPDYCIPCISLFNEYYFPNNDPTKSKLGKKGRIRAIKFNFQFEDESNPIYSYGILIPFNEVKKYIITELSNSPNQINVPIAIGKSCDGGIEPQFNFWSGDFPYQEILKITKYISDDNIEGS
ncbi:hypothetical protein M0P65_07850, partial [Candidatus Gracilibacteria bacterium]|nr:hypothetical protein [Candidatus Gracilibacteria bacterium]